MLTLLAFVLALIAIVTVVLAVIYVIDADEEVQSQKRSARIKVMDTASDFPKVATDYSAFLIEGSERNAA